MSEASVVYCMSCGEQPGSPFYCADCQEIFRKELLSVRARCYKYAFEKIGLPHLGGRSYSNTPAEGKSQVYFSLDPKANTALAGVCCFGAAVIHHSQTEKPYDKDWWSCFLWSTANDLTTRLNPELGDLTMDDLLHLKGLGIQDLGLEYHTAWRDQGLAELVTRRVENALFTIVTTPMPKASLESAYGIHGPRLIAALDHIGWTEVR